MFLRNSSPPDGLPATSFDRWMLLDLSGAGTTELAAVGDGTRLYEQRASGGLAALRRSDGRGTLVFGDGLHEPSVDGWTSVAEHGRSVLSFPMDEVVRVGRDGEVNGRWMLAGNTAIADPGHRWVLRQIRAVPGDPPQRVTFLDLTTDEVRDVPIPEPSFLGRAWFDESHVILALTPSLGFDDFAPPRYELLSVALDSFETLPLDTSDVTVAAYDRCDERLLAIGSTGAVVSFDPRTGARSELTSPNGYTPYQLYQPFAALAALSPDGRYLVWLGSAEDDSSSLIVSDLHEGRSTVVHAPRIPAPWGCCEQRAIDASLGSFRDGYLSVGVASRFLVPVCSCAGPEHPTPTAYRLRLEPAELVEIPHCGRSVPWMLEGGRLLVCEETDDRVELAVADEFGIVPVSEGPWDVGALPLTRPDALGCAAP